ncbi:hypothetical protein DL93DRAFT_2099845 [Clavulina sp. PMI_390]|nr:hypothetical protein DL93DRAFT_2099845 [Clavulina sp. PMI_390]
MSTSISARWTDRFASLDARIHISSRSMIHSLPMTLSMEKGPPVTCCAKNNLAYILEWPKKPVASTTFFRLEQELHVPRFLKAVQFRSLETTSTWTYGDGISPTYDASLCALDGLTAKSQVSSTVMKPRWHQIVHDTAFQAKWRLTTHCEHHHITINGARVGVIWVALAYGVKYSHVKPRHPGLELRGFTRVRTWMRPSIRAREKQKTRRLTKEVQPSWWSSLIRSQVTQRRVQKIGDDRRRRRS